MSSSSSWKRHYSRSLKAHEGYLHFCAHSHHLWPDVTREAQLEAWDAAASLSDRKWDEVFGAVLPETQKALAERLGVSRPERITLGTNTHELFVRLVSCFESVGRPLKILSTDSEFHSFRRQTARLRESGEVELRLVPQSPRETFAERLVSAARDFAPDMIFLSHVFFNTGTVLPGEIATLERLKSQCSMLVLDVYHSFAARPFSLRDIEDDVYVVGGSYKYLQGGEGACFLYTPPKAETLRPKFTGWYAHFEALGAAPDALCGYSEGAGRFWGSTFDPTAFYRLRTVLRFMKEQGLTSELLHAHSLRLQEKCLEGLAALPANVEWVRALKDAAARVPASGERGNFLSFPLPPGRAKQMQRKLEELKILSDSRESAELSFLRLGFGVYHDGADIEEFFLRIRKAASSFV
jgi:selenocysteine lyase/cysteine desulfurase